MPRALAIETSGRTGSVALVDGETTVSEEQFPHGLKHAAHIVSVIDRLCSARSWKPRDLEHLYLSIGPGSFTGLRIAVTLAKTLAMATGVKLVAVPTVRALVENAPPETKHVVTVLDAKRDQIFTARFERTNDDWQEREPAHLDNLSAVISRAPRPLYLAGEGIPYHAKFIPADDTIHVTTESIWTARASAVAKIGTAMAARGEFSDALTLSPLYIRRPEAEEKLESRQ